MNRLKLLVTILAVLTVGTGAIATAHAVDYYHGKPTTQKVYLGEDKRIKTAGKKISISGNKDIAKVDFNGVVKTFRPGKVSIDIYGLTTHDRVYLDIARKQEITTDKKEYTFAFGDKTFKIEAKTNSPEGNEITFESNNHEVVKPLSNGEFQVGHAGKAKITITADRSKSYHKAEKEIPVTVKKKDITLQTDKEEYSIFTDTKDCRIKSTPQGKYEIEDKKIAEIDENGNVKPLAVGKTTVRVYIEETDDVNGAEKKVSLEIKKPTATDKAFAAVAWAKEIAADDSFTYGAGKRAHRGGCYFCGTNLQKKGKSLVNGHSYEKTYCCNPFVFAAYAHGAQIPSVLRSCQNGGCGGMSPSDWTPHGFVTVGECSDVPYGELLPGDVIISDNKLNGWVHHVWMFAGNNEYVEASGGGWGANSIAVKSNAEKNYSSYQKHKCYVMRYQ